MARHGRAVSQSVNLGARDCLRVTAVNDMLVSEWVQVSTEVLDSLDLELQEVVITLDVVLETNPGCSGRAVSALTG